MPFEAATTLISPGTDGALLKNAERHASKWLGAIAYARLANTRSSTKQAQHAQAYLASVSSVTLIVTKELPFWAQHDPEMDTKMAWAARRRLRHDGLVIEKLQLWWDCALRSVTSADHAQTTLDRESYYRLSRLLHKAMIKEYDEADADACAAADWITDSRGKDEIDQERFFDCIFELADIWTRSISADEYASFLQRLLDDVAIDGEGQQLYFWREVEDTTYGGYVAVEEEAEGGGGSGGGGGEDGGREPVHSHPRDGATRRPRRKAGGKARKGRRAEGEEECEC